MAHPWYELSKTEVSVKLTDAGIDQVWKIMEKHLIDTLKKEQSFVDEIVQSFVWDAKNQDNFIHGPLGNMCVHFWDLLCDRKFIECITDIQWNKIVLTLEDRILIAQEEIAGIMLSEINGPIR